MMAAPKDSFGLFPPLVRDTFLKNAKIFVHFSYLDVDNCYDVCPLSRAVGLGVDDYIVAVSGVLGEVGFLG